MTYLRARYYDPYQRRFISEDPHWNVNNMIYGDKEQEYLNDLVPSIEAIIQSANLYAYCMNNPILYKDKNGEDFAIAIAGIVITVEEILAAGITISSVYYFVTNSDFVDMFIEAVYAFGKSIVDSLTYAKSKLSDKERATDIPSWTRGNKPYQGENGKDFAKRLCDERYGEGNYDMGPGSEYNKIKKYGDRYDK